MEFDKDKPASDDERRLAETKKLTLQPMHSDIEPEPVSDAQTVARHLAGPAIENSEIDTEQNAPLIQPSKSVLEKPQPTKKWKNERKFVVVLVATTIVVTLAAAGIAVAFSTFFLSR